MLRWLLLCLALLLPAACAGGLKPPLRDPRPSAAYTEAEGPAIEVRVADIHPRARIRDVRLEGPDGARVSGVAVARLLPEAEGEGAGRPTVDLGVRGGSGGRIVPGVGLSWSPDGVTSYEEIWLIPLPGNLPRPLDPDSWRIKVDYLDSEGMARYRRLALPEPPRG